MLKLILSMKLIECLIAIYLNLGICQRVSSWISDVFSLLSFLYWSFTASLLSLRWSHSILWFYIVLIGGWFTNLCIRQDLCPELQRHVLYPLSFLCKNHSQTEWFKTVTLARGVGCFVLVLLMDLRFAFGQDFGGAGVFLFHVVSSRLAGGVHF